MDRTEELLLILAEECAEVSQAATKCIRFGMGSWNPWTDSKTNPVSNREKLEQELGDFMAMFKLILAEDPQLSESNIMKAAEAKLIKVEKFMKNGKPKPAYRSNPGSIQNPIR